MIDRTVSEEKILNAYMSSYDIEMADEEKKPLLYTGDFHVHSENYVLDRKAQLFALDTFDHLYVYGFDSLKTLDVVECVAKAHENGFAKIHPNKIHRSSYITVLFFCNSIEKNAISFIKHYCKRKNFKFSLEGWMEVHVVCIDFGKDKIYRNGDGRNTGKFLKDVLHPRKRSIISKLFSR